MDKHIVLTGGGTAGHVTPNLALLPALKKAGYKVSYIGSYSGIEKELIEKEGIDYYAISSGKFRRQLTAKNLVDSFRVIRGMKQADKLMKTLDPDIVFSKGGYVSVPVVFAAKKRNIPVIIHESDITLGLANKLSMMKSKIVCCNFETTLKFIQNGKGLLTGSPIREELFEGDPERGKEYTGLKNLKPIILIMGGSLGAKAINDVVHTELNTLLEKYEIIHICGKDKTIPELNVKEGYIQFEYVDKAMADLMSMADAVISRAGANTICELLSLRKPNILIPLTKLASRGDQLLNAQEFKAKGYSYVLEEEKLNIDTLIEALDEVIDNKDKYIQNMETTGIENPITRFIELFEENKKER